MVDADSGFRDGDVWAIHSGRIFSAARKSISDVLKVTRPVLILFDCDGTLVDSQFSIIAAMHAAFQAEKLPVPDAETVRRVVGLPLVEAIARIASDQTAVMVERMAGHYKEAFSSQRRDESLHEPLYPGIGEVVIELHKAGCIVGVATGKSHRGLVATLEKHHLLPHFSTLQTADLGPGKPNPDMVYRALGETGVEAENCVMIGDTVFDIEMSRAAGIASIGVNWGYHPVDELTAAGADRIIRQSDQIIPAITELLNGALEQ